MTKRMKVSAAAALVLWCGVSVLVTGCESREDREAALEHVKQGGQFMEREDYDTAILEYTDAIRLAPKLVLAYINRGGAYWMKGNKTQARVNWRKALQIDPNNTAARDNLAKYR